MKVIVLPVLAYFLDLSLANTEVTVEFSFFGLSHSRDVLVEHELISSFCNQFLRMKKLTSNKGKCIFLNFPFL